MAAGTSLGFHTEHGHAVVVEDREREAVFETPLSVAVMIAVCDVVMVPAVTVNVAVLVDAGIMTVAGTVSAVLLSASTT